MKRIGAREWAQQGVHWRTIIAWATLLLAHRIQYERGRPAGAVGASLEVAVDQMVVTVVVVLVGVAAIGLVKVVSATTWAAS